MNDKSIEQPDSKGPSTPKGPRKKTRLQKAAIETATPITKSRYFETLRDSSIEDIRYNSLLLSSQPEESPEDQILSTKKETERRIEAYTTGKDSDGWYTLNYAQYGNDSKGFSHERFVGLGDIITDPDIQLVEVQKRDGTIIKGKRGVVPSGRQRGRIGYLDENDKYIATFTGDKFRIVQEKTTNPEDEKSKKDYLTRLQKESDARVAHRKRFISEGQIHSTFNEEMYSEEILKDKIPETAEKEVHVPSEKEIIERIDHNLIIPQGKKLIAYSKKVCQELGVPVTVVWSIFHRESYYDPFARYRGPKTSSATGMGQFLKGTWKQYSTEWRNSNIHHPEWDHFFPRDPEGFKVSRYNPYATIYATAWQMKKAKTVLKLEGLPLEKQGVAYYLAHHEGIEGAKRYLTFLKHMQNEGYNTLQKIKDLYEDEPEKFDKIATVLFRIQQKRIRNHGIEEFLQVYIYAREIGSRAVRSSIG